MSNKPPKKSEIFPTFMQISNISTGFIEIPGQISLNLHVQGCKMRCKGCQNPELLPFEGGTTITLDDLPLILKGRDLPTWICWLGGDAVYQSEGFLAFNRFFKECGYKICLYTGKMLDDVKELLENVDLVVDGAWEGIPVVNENTNQGVYLKNNSKWNKKSFVELKETLLGV